VCVSHGSSLSVRWKLHWIKVTYSFYILSFFPVILCIILAYCRNHKYFFSMLICYAVTVLLLLTMCGLICYDFFAEPLNSNSDLLFEKITELDILGRTYSFVVAIVLSVICMIVAVPLSFMVYA